MSGATSRQIAESHLTNFQMCYKHALVQAVSETSEAKVENGDDLIENVEDLSLHCLNEHVLF